ncbi:unnamed protein product [Coccothraustes coccothraustes]
MATGTDWSCPICQNTRSDVASALPCKDQFCLGCILRWAKTNPACPLCSRPMEIVRFSERSERDYLQFAITASEELAEDSSQAGSAPFHLIQNSPHHPRVSPPPSPQRMLSPDEQGAAEPEFMEVVGSLLPKVWAELFQKEEHVLDPMLPWLRQRLEAIYGSQWWPAVRAENSILYALCLCGPDEEVMVQMLQPLLEEYTEQLVDATVSFIVGQCSEEAQRLLRSHAAGKEDNSPEASSCPTSSQGGTPAWHPNPASSPASSDMDEQPSTSEAALCALHMLQPSSPSHPPSMTSCSEQDQPQEEQEQIVATAGPSSQGCSPSAPDQGREHSSGEPRHARKKRTPSLQDSPRPKKRPPRQQH